MNRAQLRLMQLRLAQASPGKREPIVDQAENVASLTNGGFRAGKRKRGNSLLKRRPRQATTVTTYNVKDEYGTTVAKINTLKYKRST